MRFLGCQKPALEGSPPYPMPQPRCTAPRRARSWTTAKGHRCRRASSGVMPPQAPHLPAAQKSRETPKAASKPQHPQKELLATCTAPWHQPTAEGLKMPGERNPAEYLASRERLARDDKSFPDPCTLPARSLPHEI